MDITKSQWSQIMSAPFARTREGLLWPTKEEMRTRTIRNVSMLGLRKNRPVLPAEVLQELLLHKKNGQTCHSLRV